MQGSHSLLLSSVCSYQVVLEHSILGALEATRQKTMESRPENLEPANTKHRRRHHAPTRRSGRRGEILKKCEEILENLRSQVSDLRKEAELEEGWNENFKEDSKFQKLHVIVNHHNQKKNEGKPVSIITESEEAKERHCKGDSEDTELDVAKQEAETGNEGDVCEIREGAIDFVRDKERRKEIGGDLEPRQEQVKTEAPREKESLTEEPPPEPLDRGADTSEMCILHEGESMAKIVVQDSDPREGSLSLVTGSGEVEKIDGWIGEGREVRRDGREPPPETPDSDVTVAETVQFARDLGKRSFSLVTDDSDMFGRKRKVRANWISRELGFWTEIMGQAQYLLVTPPQLTNTRRVFQEEKGGKNGIEVFHINMRWQALHAHLPTAGHHIRMFNLPLESSVVTSLSDDQLISPIYANKRLEKLSPTNFWLIVKDENGRSHDLQLLFIVLVGVGGNYDNGSIQLTNISFMDKPPLVHHWGLGGFIRGGWNPSGIRRDVKVNILESANTNAIKVTRIQIHQNLEVLFNLQQLIGFVGDYGGVFMSSKMLKSHSIIAFPFNDEERWLQETRGIEIKKHLPCTLEVGLFLKILRDKGSTSVLQQFIQVHDLIAKKAWVTEVGLLDTIYGGQAVPTLGQFFNNLLLPREVISLLIDEHLIQRTGYSTISMAETHHKQWVLGENFSDSCIIETSCFKLWDPGGLCLLFTNHLEDKVNFKGRGVDTDISYEGQTGKFTKVYERRKWRKPIGGPTAESSSAQTPESN